MASYGFYEIGKPNGVPLDATGLDIIPSQLPPENLDPLIDSNTELVVPEDDLPVPPKPIFSRPVLREPLELSKPVVLEPGLPVLSQISEHVPVIPEHVPVIPEHVPVIRMNLHVPVNPKHVPVNPEHVPVNPEHGTSLIPGHKVHLLPQKPGPLSPKQAVPLSPVPGKPVPSVNGPPFLPESDIPNTPEPTLPLYSGSLSHLPMQPEHVLEPLSPETPISGPLIVSKSPLVPIDKPNFVTEAEVPLADPAVVAISNDLPCDLEPITPPVSYPRPYLGPPFTHEFLRKKLIPGRTRKLNRKPHLSRPETPLSTVPCPNKGVPPFRPNGPPMKTIPPSSIPSPSGLSASSDKVVTPIVSNPVEDLSPGTLVEQPPTPLYKKKFLPQGTPKTYAYIPPPEFFKAYPDSVAFYEIKNSENSKTLNPLTPKKPGALSKPPINVHPLSILEPVPPVMPEHLLPVPNQRVPVTPNPTLLIEEVLPVTPNPTLLIEELPVAPKPVLPCPKKLPPTPVSAIPLIEPLPAISQPEEVLIPNIIVSEKENLAPTVVRLEDPQLPDNLQAESLLPGIKPPPTPLYKKKFLTQEPPKVYDYVPPAEFFKAYPASLSFYGIGGKPKSKSLPLDVTPAEKIPVLPLDPEPVLPLVPAPFLPVATIPIVPETVLPLLPEPLPPAPSITPVPEPILSPISPKPLLPILVTPNPITPPAPCQPQSQSLGELLTRLTRIDEVLQYMMLKQPTAPPTPCVVLPQKQPLLPSSSTLEEPPLPKPEYNLYQPATNVFELPPAKPQPRPLVPSPPRPVQSHIFPFPAANSIPKAQLTGSYLYDFNLPHDFSASIPPKTNILQTPISDQVSPNPISLNNFKTYFVNKNAMSGHSMASANYADMIMPKLLEPIFL
ncbi:hypothetical protein WDU94_000250 [Cyamophila willieti]